MDSQQLPLQVGVKALLKNREGKYLLLRRNPKKYPDMQPTWDIVGGRIHLNVSLMENLRREVKEEAGLDLIADPKLVAAQDIIRPDKHVVRLTYIGEIEGEPAIDEDHLEAKWFTAGELKAMNREVLDGFFRDLLDNGTIDL